MMGIMTIGTIDLAIFHWMVVWQVKLSPHVRMTTKTNGWRFSGVNDGIISPAAIRMNTPWPMAHFTPYALQLLMMNRDFGMRGGIERGEIGLMTGKAVLRPNEIGIGNIRGHSKHRIRRDA